MYAKRLIEERFNITLPTDDLVGSTARVEQPINEQYGVVIKLKNGGYYIIEDDDG